MAQITSITSESLQAKIRTLLPSQQGFGEDLQASNVILPVIDLTPAAEGTSVPAYQAQAWSFGSITAFEANNSTDVVANTTGFFRIFGVSSNAQSSAQTNNNRFTMTDGLSTKNIWTHEVTGAGGTAGSAVTFDFIVFLRSGDSISAVSTSTAAKIAGSSRQVATVTGEVVYPVGFTPQ